MERKKEIVRPPSRLEYLKLSFKSPKIFCIGFNKTGSTSLHFFFERSGIRNLHADTWPAYSHVKYYKFYFMRAQSFNDGEQADFIRLDRWFPDALFILNDRDERAWLRSRVKHVLRRGLPPDLGAFLRTGETHRFDRDFMADPERAIERWIADRRIYHSQVEAYFAGSPRFLWMSVTDDAGWAPKLAGFLASHGVTISEASLDPPRANVRKEEKIRDAETLERLYAVIDRELARVGPEKVRAI